MEGKGSKIVRIGTGRKCTDNIWYEESDSFETVDDKSDVDSPELKLKRRKITKGKKRGKKPNTQKTVEPEPEPEAGPSGLCQHKTAPVIKKEDSKPVYKHKRPSDSELKFTKPYEVRWGQAFLNTLLPSSEIKKGILKQSGTEIKMKPRTTFSETTVYYFERARCRSKHEQLLSSMERHHFYSSHLPVDVFEEQKEMRQKKPLAASNRMDVDDDNKNWNLQKVEDEDKIIHTIQVPIELMEEDASKQNIVQRKTKGCGCNIYCDPDICECNLLGKQCEVFKDNFPCSCQMEFCKNTNGRVAYNDRYVPSYSVSFPTPIQRINQIKDDDKGLQLIIIRYVKS